MRIFGLIGKPLTHSFSPAFFQEKFLRENFQNCDYRLFPLNKASDLKSIISNNPHIEGLNVTIPFKRDVIPFLDELETTAKKIGAVNTIRIFRTANKIILKGYNTDVFGFLYGCNGLRQSSKALTLGSGGSAQAVRFALGMLNIECFSVSRKPIEKNQFGYNDLTSEILNKFSLIINTTPLGMYPNMNEAPPIPYHLLTSNHFLFDLVYNPSETLFMKMGKQAGATVQNGELMLELQAERSWEIWNE
jgi:shikimate dehydrogenase